MRIAMWIVAIFGAVVLLGGIIGYLQAHSLASLIAGSTAGLILLGSAVALMRGADSGRYIALLIAALLTIFFHYRFVHTGAFMPSGLMAILSCLVTMALLIFRPSRKS